MPLLDVNNVAILLRTEIDPEDSNVINEFDLFFDRVREVLDNTLGQFQPKILAIDDKGNVHPAHYYEDISPYQKGNEMITTIQTIMKQHLNNLIENDEGYEGPAAEMNFDECIEGEVAKVCLLTKSISEVEGNDPQICTVLRSNLNAYEHALAEQLQKALDNNEFVSSKSAQQLARFLVMGIYGIRTYALTNQDPKSLQQLADDLFAALVN